MNPRNIDWFLYAILDKAFIGSQTVEFVAEELIAGGAGIIQLRDKVSGSQEIYEDSRKVQEVTRRRGIPFIVNDRVDVALAVNADGVHLGQDDLPFAEARKMIGNEMMLGASVHNEEELERSLGGSPDYFGVGTIYPTDTKAGLSTRGVEIVRNLRIKTTAPLIAIGGITLENLGPVIEAGADGVAAISNLLLARDVRQKAQEIVKKVRLARRPELSKNYLV